MATPTLTTALLTQADSSNPAPYYDAIVPAMNALAAAYGLDTVLRLAHFLAQIGHESGFRMVEENGDYSPQRMRQVFGCRGGPSKYDAAKDDATLGRLRPKLWLESAKYAHNPRNLLSYAYALRLGNGDEASGEGYAYRGRGMMQLTGKTNYAAFTKAHNAKNPADPKDFVALPDLLVSTQKYGVESAFFFWDTRNLNALADRDDVAAVTAAINGGDNGLDDRKLRLARIKHALGA